jgi:flagellar biosynthesis/type III secretory pathway chaperone
MAEGIARLIELLTEKEGALQELLHLLEEEQACLVQLDMAKLQSQAERKQELYDRLTRSARLCRQLIDQLAGELGVAGAHNLSPLLPAMPLPQRETLQGLQQRLLDLGKGLEKLSSLNGHLLQGALGTVNRSLEFFGRMFNRSTTYGGAGQMVAVAPAARLLRREA